MRRLQHLALTATLAALALAAGACTDAGNNMIILANKFPNAMCQADTNLQNNILASGLYDLDSPFLYQLFLVVQNSAPGNPDDDNQDFVLIEGVDARIEFLGGFLDAVPDGARETVQAGSESTTLLAGNIPPGGLASVPVNAFNQSSVVALRDSGVFSSPDVRAIARIEFTVFGELDGTTVESNPFRYPVTLCRGCSTVIVGECPAEGLGGGYPCGGLQDSQILCCSNPDGSLDCGE